MQTQEEPTMFKFIKEIFQDHSDNFSSKRFVTILCVIMMVSAFFGDLIWDVSVPQLMYEAVMYIVVAGLGFTGAEKFADRKSSITD